MQHKKKNPAKKSADVASPRASARQRKMPENVHPQAKEAADVITSSVRKQKMWEKKREEMGEEVGVSVISFTPVDQLDRSRNLPKSNKGCALATNFNATFGLVEVDTSGVRTDHDETLAHNNDSDNMKGFDDDDSGNEVTIFSPAYHISRNLGGEPENEDFFKYFHHEERLSQDRGNNDLNIDVVSENVLVEERNFDEDFPAWPGSGGAISSDVSSVYLSVKSSKLECVDEYDQEHSSAEGCINEEEMEELEFDPYFFIKNLPDLQSVVPAFRPILLPKQTRSCPSTTLVLDLDETLVHSTLEPCQDADFTFSVDFNMKDHTVFVRCRPHLKDFMDTVYGLFEIIIFTASQSIYAEQLLNVLDPKRRVFRHRVYRESCVFVNGNYIKDLTVLGRDLAHVIIIDNSPQAFGFQIDNGIPIESWFDDRSDEELLSLLPFLESLIGVEDVRPLIAEKFNLREKIAAADSPLRSARRDFLVR